MNKIAAISMFLIVFSATALAQQPTTAARSRPRIATASPSPTVTQSDSSTPNSAQRPPVLKGGTNSGAQQTSANVPADEAIEDDEIIRVDTSLVTIPVSVLDRQGRFVAGLQKKDFKIFENGVEQQIDSFSTVETPFTVVLLIDVSPSTAYQIDEIHNAAIAFVNQLRRDDKVIVISFDERVRVLSRATSDRETLRRAILQAEFGDGTSLYEAVDNTMTQQLRSVEGRKAVVIFTDGVDTTSRRATYQSTIQNTQETDILFYPVRYDTYDGGSGNSQPNGGQGGGILGKIIGGIFGGGNVQIGGGGGQNPGSRNEYETGRRYLEDLARSSGGRTFEANLTNNIDAAFSGIAEELRRQYSIGYYPEAVGKSGELKQVKVRVMQPNLAVRAKNSYVVGAADKKPSGK